MSKFRVYAPIGIAVLLIILFIVLEVFIKWSLFWTIIIVSGIIFSGWAGYIFLRKKYEPDIVWGDNNVIHVRPRDETILQEPLLSERSIPSAPPPSPQSQLTPSQQSGSMRSQQSGSMRSRSTPQQSTPQQSTSQQSTLSLPSFY